MIRIVAILLYVLVWGSLAIAQEDVTVIYRGNPGRTGVYDVQSIAITPDIAWQRQFDTSELDALLVEDRLFVAATESRNQTRLYALNAQDGAEQWVMPVRGAVIGSMVYTKGLLLLGTSAGGLLALDAASGQERWRFADSGRVWSSPLVVDDRVFITSENGWFAVDLDSGEEIWHKAGCEQGALSAFHNGTVFFPCETMIHALDAMTGDEMWSIDVEDGAMFHLAIADQLLIATGERFIHAVDLQTRTVVWSIEGGEFWSAPSVNDRAVLAGNMDGKVSAFALADGARLWQIEVGDWATADPILIADTLYFGIGNHIDPVAPRDYYAVDAATGAIQWQVTVDGMVIAAAEAADNRLYVTTNNGTLYALQG